MRPASPPGPAGPAFGSPAGGLGWLPSSSGAAPRPYQRWERVAAVHIQVPIHATRHQARVSIIVNAIPAFHCSVGMAPPLRAARWIVLLAQGDPPHSSDGTTIWNLADASFSTRAS